MRALLVAAVEHRFGRVNRLPLTIEWLSDNGSVASLVIPAASLASSVLNREQRQSKVRRAMKLPKPSCVRSSVITSAPVRDRTPRPF
jgi:hypothetical protein